MKFAYGSSKKGDVSEALRTITEPAALFFSVAKEDMLEPVRSRRLFPVWHPSEVSGRPILTDSFLTQASRSSR